MLQQHWKTAVWPLCYCDDVTQDLQSPICAVTLRQAAHIYLKAYQQNLLDQQTLQSGSADLHLTTWETNIWIGKMLYNIRT